MRAIFLPALAAALLLPGAAEAGHRHHRHHRAPASYALDPQCNLPGPNPMTCEGGAPSPRGLWIARKMNFGSAVQRYTPATFRKAPRRARTAQQRVPAHAPPRAPGKDQARAPGLLGPADHPELLAEVPAPGAGPRTAVASLGNLSEVLPSRPDQIAPKLLGDGRAVIRASTGAVAYVAARAAGAFQCVVNALEATGYKIKEMGGFASRGHIRHSLHYSGNAVDINQIERNVTDPPMPRDEVAIANGCGLISGAQWRDADSGHFQLGGYDGRRTRYAGRHHHRVRYAHHRRWTRHARRHRDARMANW